MNTIKPLLFVAALCCTIAVNAQIFINTGNPNLDKYKNENPNAVIWEKGKSVPIPPNTPEEPKKEPEKKQVEVKKEKVKAKVEAPIKKTEQVKAKETPAVPAKPKVAVTGDYPPNAIPGKCYARCVVPDQYEIKEEQVVDQPAPLKWIRFPLNMKPFTIQ